MRSWVGHHYLHDQLENRFIFQDVDVINFKMDSIEIDNWAKIAQGMEASGDTESWFYLRARAIADGKPDPMPNLSQLMPEELQ